MKPNVEVKGSPMEGQGVFACKDFNKGEFVLVIDDSHVVTKEMWGQLTEKQHEYDLDYLDDKVVIMQEPERLINHSCDPNVYTRTGNDQVRRVFAMRNISKGDEIVYDYSMNGDNEGTFECNCGAKICRGVYQGNFFKLPKQLQIKYIPYLDGWFVEKYQKEVTNLQNLSADKDS